MGVLTLALASNAVALVGSGALCIAWPVGFWELYTEAGAVHGDDVRRLLAVVSRLAGALLACCGVVCALACVKRISSAAHRRMCLAFASALMLSWAVVQGLSSLGGALSSTAVAAGTSAPVAFLVVNCAALMLDLHRDIPDATPHTAASRVNPAVHSIQAAEDNEAAPLLSGDRAASAAAEDCEGEEKKKKREGRGWKRLLSLAKPEMRIIAAGCLALLVRLPFSLAVPHFVAEVIGCLIKEDYSGARFNVLLLAAAGTIDAALDFWNFFLFGFAQQKLVMRLRNNIFTTLLRQEVAYFDVTSCGDCTSRLQVDTAEMGNDLTWVFRWTIEAVGRIVGIVAYMFVRDWRLACVAVGATPLCGLVGKLYGDWLEKNAEKVQTALAASNEVAQEVMSSVRTVYSFNNQAHESERYAKEIKAWYHLNVKQVFMQALYYMAIATFLVNTCVQAAILLYGSYLVKSGHITPSVLIAFMLYQGMLQQWVSSLLNCFTNLIKSTGAGAKVFDILDRKPEIVPPEAPSSHAITEESGVAFEGVEFKYATRDEMVLKDVSLRIQPGKVVALVGLSGAGKSTLFHLLERFYLPGAGSVTIGGVDVGSIADRELHTKVAIVGQEPVLFAGSIFNNIVYSVLCEAPHLLAALAEDEPLRRQYMKRVRDAAQTANALGFIEALPRGFDTEVGEKGVMLSGGQKQRIAIARALMPNPKVCTLCATTASQTSLPTHKTTQILLLDEATSALDASSETLVQEALDKASEGRTTVVIAHRLSTVAKVHPSSLLDFLPPPSLYSHADPPFVGTNTTRKSPRRLTAFLCSTRVVSCRRGRTPS